MKNILPKTPEGKAYWIGVIDCLKSINDKRHFIIENLIFKKLSIEKLNKIEEVLK